EDAVNADDYDAALRLLGLADAAARKANNAPLVSRVEARNKEVREISKSFESARPALDALKKNPDDAAANFAAGKFLCFAKGDWDKGLPLLSQGSDAALKALAAKELDEPVEAAAQVEVGDGWWDRAQGDTGIAKVRLLARAYHWYEQALPHLTGLAQ